MVQMIVLMGKNVMMKQEAKGREVFFFLLKNVYIAFGLSIN